MPTYEYYCISCDKTSEITQSITEGRKRKCPQCGALKLKRMISTGIRVIFRGTPGSSGFHSLDYPKDKQE